MGWLGLAEVGYGVWRMGRWGRRWQRRGGSGVQQRVRTSSANRCSATLIVWCYFIYWPWRGRPRTATGDLPVRVPTMSSQPFKKSTSVKRLTQSQRNRRRDLKRQTSLKHTSSNLATLQSSLDCQIVASPSRTPSIALSPTPKITNYPFRLTPHAHSRATISRKSQRPRRSRPSRATPAQ